MDITPYIGPLVTAMVAAGGTYAALTGRIARLEARVDHLDREQPDMRLLASQMATLTAKFDSLHEEVAKHNKVIERTFRLETEMTTNWHRLDELRDEMHERLGGSNGH
jgi:uncharacterized protein YlxW (UPF0749 family)